MSEAVDSGETPAEFRRRMARMDHHIRVLRERQLARRKVRAGVKRRTNPR